jgi:dynein heavy chain
MILAFSPVGTKFRTRATMFPSLFSQCSIDWFLPWPAEALVDVSGGFLRNFEMECNSDDKESLIMHMGEVHNFVRDVSELYF